MSYVIIDKEVLKAACLSRLENVQDVYAESYDKIVEAARHVWWRKLLRLPPLDELQAKERAKKQYREEMFGGAIGNLLYCDRWRRALPEKLLAACAVATDNKVYLSVEDAEAVEGWK